MRVFVFLGLMVPGANALPAANRVAQQPAQEQPAQRRVVLADQQAGRDTGARIASADAALGSTPGEIRVTQSGEISSPIVLSPNHHLVCQGTAVILTMSTAQAAIIQASNTRVSRCTLSSSQTELPASGGEIFSQGASNVQVDGVSFIGGGDHIRYNQVSNFIIKNTLHSSIGARNASPISIVASTHGQIISPHIGGFTVPGALGDGVRLIGIRNSSFVEVSDPIIENVDASTVPACGGVSFTTSTNSSLRGGQISGLKNCDGVLTESGASDIEISGTSSVDHNSSTGAGPHAGNGEGFDIFNSRRVRLSNVTASGNGLIPHGQQLAGIEASNSIDVSMRNCIADENGIEGIRIDGSLGVEINDSETDRNGSSGIIVMPVPGIVSATHDSAVVNWTGRGGITFSRVWPPGTKIVIGGQVYAIESLQSTGQLTLTSNFHGATGEYPYRVDSYVEITGGESLDNGQRSADLPAKQNGGVREGVYFTGVSGELIGRVSHLRASDTQSRKTQTYGIRVENKGRIVAEDNIVTGNLLGGIQDSPGRSTIH